MLRRKAIPFILLLAAAGAGGIAPSPALARPHVVTQKTGSHGYVFLVAGLLPTHRYSVQVLSKGKRSFTGHGTEYLTFFYKNRLSNAARPHTFTGTTPHSFLIKPPTGNFQMTGWGLAVQLRLGSRNISLTVKVLDLGKNK